MHVKTVAEKLTSIALDFEVRSTPMATGLSLMRATIPAGWRRPPANLDPFLSSQADLWWDAPGHPVPAYRYDKNAMYVATLGAVKLGSGFYQMAGSFEDLPGIWQVKILHAPFPFDHTHAPAIASGVSWLYTDLVASLRPFGYEYEVLSGYIFREYHQIFRQFYERIRSARNNLLGMPGPDGEQARKLLKLIYGSSLACLAHKPDRQFSEALYRPDWYYGVISHAKARMFSDMRAVWMATGLRPILVHTDTLGYELQTSLRLGVNIGDYKRVQS